MSSLVNFASALVISSLAATVGTGCAAAPDEETTGADRAADETAAPDAPSGGGMAPISQDNGYATPSQGAPIQGGYGSNLGLGGIYGGLAGGYGALGGLGYGAGLGCAGGLGGLGWGGLGGLGWGGLGGCGLGGFGGFGGFGGCGLGGIGLGGCGIGGFGGFGGW